MNKPTEIRTIEVLLLSFGAALLFTSFLLVCALFWTDALIAGLAGMWALGLVYLSNRLNTNNGVI